MFQLYAISPLKAVAYKWDASAKVSGENIFIITSVSSFTLLFGIKHCSLIRFRIGYVTVDSNNLSKASQ